MSEIKDSSSNGMAFVCGELVFGIFHDQKLVNPASTTAFFALVKSSSVAKTIFLFQYGCKEIWRMYRCALQEADSCTLFSKSVTLNYVMTVRCLRRYCNEPLHIFTGAFVLKVNYS